MNTNVSHSLKSARRALHELLKSLPAIKQRGSEEAIKRHLQLIAQCQRRYDQLVALSQMTEPAAMTNR
ncbi:MAG: hypothetical protein KTR35_09575 [Gammaproteobacteria bacterium]|nr:hypothetical protein [Gammaproteobacteria bacterium]